MLRVQESTESPVNETESIIQEYRERILAGDWRKMLKN